MEIHAEEVGVRHLKAHLAHHLRRVRAGARLTITDRGRPIATLAPVEAKSVDWAVAMVAERRAHWRGGKPQGMSRRIPSRGRPASAMVLEDRR